MKAYVVRKEIIETEIKSVEELKQMSMPELFDYARNLPYAHGDKGWTDEPHGAVPAGDYVDIWFEFFTNRKDAENCMEITPETETVMEFCFKAQRKFDYSLAITDIKEQVTETAVQCYFKVGCKGKIISIVDTTIDGYII